MNNILDSELRVDKANDIPKSSYFICIILPKLNNDNFCIED